MFEVRHISVLKKKALLLDQVNFTTRPGELVAIIGPNGAGKSTLLKCLSGLLSPTEGIVCYDNMPVSGYTPEALARQRAMLSQQVMTAFDFNVEEVVMMGRYPHIKRHPAGADYEIVDKSLQLCGVIHLKGRKASTLSGGELQRVHFARTLAQLWEESNRAKLLLLDEPVNNLDPRYQHELLHISSIVARKQTTAVVTVLHDLNLAANYASRVVMLQKGKLVADGKPEEVMTPEKLGQLYGLPVQTIHKNGMIHIVCGHQNQLKQKQPDNYEKLFV